MFPATERQFLSSPFVQEVTEGKITAGMVGWCPVPRLNSRGWVKLEVSSNRNAWTVYTYIIASEHNGWFHFGLLGLVS